MATCAELRTRLAEAERAAHKLELGSSVERIGSGPMQVQYRQADLAQLRAYVTTLRAQVAACDGSTYSRRRVLGVIPTDG